MLFPIVIVIIVLLISAYKYGFFQKFQMKQDSLPDSKILYLSYKGKYANVGPLFEEINKNKDPIFLFSDTFGFYYDNPEVTDPQQCRAVVGILVNQGEQFKIEQFKSHYPQYKQKKLTRSKYLYYSFPYINILSLLIMVKRIYPKLHKFLQKQKIDIQETSSGLMEIYKWRGQSKTTQILLFLNNKNQFARLYEEK